MLFAPDERQPDGNLTISVNIPGADEIKQLIQKHYAILAELESNLNDISSVRLSLIANADCDSQVIKINAPELSAADADALAARIAERLTEQHAAERDRSC